MAARGHAHARRRDVPGRRHGLVRPPVGRLHQRRRRRLGLVRGQPRRRHRPDAVARPRRRRQLPAGLRHAGRARRHAPRTSTATHSRSTSPARGRARRPAPTTRPAGRSDLPGEELTIDLRRPSPTRSSTRARRPASSTGRARRTSRRGAGRVARRLGGEAYVELTGYAPAVSVPTASAAPPTP